MEAGGKHGLDSQDNVFSSVEEALADIRAGKFVVVSDDEGRENEGDLICAALTCDHPFSAAKKFVI